MMSCGLSKEDLRIEQVSFSQLPKEVKGFITELKNKPVDSLDFASCHTIKSCDCNLKSVPKYYLPIPASNIQITACNVTYTIPFELTAFRQFIIDDENLYFYELSSYFSTGDTTRVSDIIKIDSVLISKISLKEIKENKA